MNELPSPRVSLEKRHKKETYTTVAQEHVVYRHVFAEKRTDPKLIVTLPLTNQTDANEQEEIKFTPEKNIKDASIKELSATIDSLKGTSEQEALRDSLILLRRGKAIEKASEYKYGRSNDTSIGKSIGKGPQVAKLIREGERDVSSTELHAIREAVKPNTDDTFAERIQEVNDYIEWKEDDEKIFGIGPLLADLRESTGASRKISAEVLQKSTESIKAVEKNRFSISVGDIKKLRDTAQERRKEYEEAISALTIDSEEMKERMTQGRAVRTLRNELSLAQSEVAEAAGYSQIHMSRVEKNVSHIAIAKMSGLISLFSEKGAVPDSVEMQFLISLHEGKVQLPKRSKRTGVELARLTGFTPSTVSRMLSEHGYRKFSANTLATFIEKARGSLSHEEIASLEYKLTEMRGDKRVKERKPYKRKKRSELTNVYLAEITGFSEITISRIVNESSAREVSTKTLDAFIEKIAPHGLTLEGLREYNRAKERKPYNRSVITRVELAQVTGFSEITVNRILNENDSREVSTKTLGAFIEKTRDILPLETITALEAKQTEMNENIQKQRERVITPVSAEIKTAGKIYGEIIRDLKESRGDRIDNIEKTMAEIAGCARWIFTDFRKGRIREPKAELILKALENYLSPEDERFMAIQEIFRKRELDKEWMQTLVQNGTEMKKLAKVLRLSTCLSKKEFGEKANIPEETIYNIENGRVLPLLYNAENILEASLPRILGENSRTVQLVRLASAGREPISVDELATNEKGYLVAYFRIATGATQKEFAKSMGYTTRNLERIEGNKQSMRKAKIDELIVLLGIEPESTLAKIISHRLRDKPIPEYNATDILAEKYLFKEHLQMIQRYELAEKDQEIENFDSVGEKFQFLLTREELSFREFGKIVKKYESTIRNIVDGSHIPQDFMVALLMRGLGYDIHNPTTWHMIDNAEAERTAREDIVPYNEENKL